MSYEQRLELLGYDPVCARRVAEDYREAGNTEYLEEYLAYKEAARKSISEHVTEVLG
jgi:hypothetical protein|nr:hypothetical protein [Butyricicoccus sp. AM28-25]DAP01038.1 MAG TPA: hypothetical protein [Caudoviricetes sp.]DAV09334.1 MAG TPA: hypothetical protein [Caudoviricetes sp.]DAY80750.1 MAG TPA: hypothetical protein [Caudoviricetes sp.]